MTFPAPPVAEDDSAIWSLDDLNALFQSPSLFGTLELPGDTIPAQPAQAKLSSEKAISNNRNEDVTSLESYATACEVSSQPIFHTCRRLPNTDNETLDSWFKPCDVSEPRSYKCTWADCLAEPFEGRHKARIHVRKHLGINKLYECVVCYKQFVSQGTAKRHTNTQRKAFSCKICHGEFARKDYWRVHERRCAKRHLVESLDTSLELSF